MNVIVRLEFELSNNGSGCINTTVQTHLKDADKMYKEKARRELNKNATSYIEQTLEAILHETAVRPLSLNRLINLMGRVFASGPGHLGSIPGRIIPKTFNMTLDTSLLNAQQCKVRIKGKGEQFREKSSALPYTSV